MKLTTGLAFAALWVLAVGREALSARSTHEYTHSDFLGDIDSQFYYKHEEHYPGATNNQSANVTRSNLVARWNPEPADDTLWKKLVCKGENLDNGLPAYDEEAGKMFKPPREKAQSDFKDIEADFTKWSWYHRNFLDLNPIYGDFEKTWGIRRALRVLHLSRKVFGDGGQWLIRIAKHGLILPPGEVADMGSQDYEVDGKTYHPTKARYIFAINAKQGAIMAMNTLSPQHAIKDTDPSMWPNGFYADEELPKLQATSDIAWHLWTDIAGPTMMKNILYFGRLSVVNDESSFAIARALKNNDTSLAKWPGITFGMDSDEGKAILGSPNGIGVAYFLMQHKAELRNMRVKSVRVFATERAGGENNQVPCVFFKLVNNKDGSTTKPGGDRPPPSLPPRRPKPWDVESIRSQAPSNTVVAMPSVTFSAPKDAPKSKETG